MQSAGYLFVMVQLIATEGPVIAGLFRCG